jgi:trehalose 6-phosphate synthase
MDDSERAERTARLVEGATRLPPDEWFADQLDALRR